MGGFALKARWLAALAPDIAIISEITKADFDGAGAASGAWTGAKKGLAIFGGNGWRIDVINDAPAPHVLAVRAIRGAESLLIVGVWTLPVDGDYVVPVTRGLEQIGELLTGDVMLAGDFNANPIWDKGRSLPRQFASVINDLSARGIKSIWHERTGEIHGAEATPTFYHHLHHDKPFHIDYVFTSERLRTRVQGIEIGAYADWVATKRSDHVPIIVDLGPPR